MPCSWSMRLISVSCSLAVMCCGILHASPTLRGVVVGHVDPVPGLTGATFSLTQGGQALINNNGRVAFIHNTTGTVSSAIWQTDSAGTLRAIALTGQQVPGVSGGTLSPLFSQQNGALRINQSGIGGRVVFSQTIVGAGAPPCVFAADDFGLYLEARTGQVSPTAPPGLWSVDSNVYQSINGHGFAAFNTGFAVGNGNYRAIFSARLADVEMCARNEISNQNNGFTGFGDPLINDPRYMMMFAPNRNNDGTRNGLWIGQCANFSPVVVHGLTIPPYIGLPPFETFISPQPFFSFNTFNQAVFVTGLNGSDVTSANDTALWQADNSGYRLLAREGAAVPGLTGVFYGDFANGTLVGPVISRSGHVLFVCTGTGPGVTGDTARLVMLRSPDGNMRVLARQGSTPPGFSMPTTFSGFPSAALNNWGQVCLQTTLATPPSGTSGSAIFATDLAGNLTLLYQSRSTNVEVRPGLFMRVGDPTTVYITGGSDGRPMNWNDRGEYVFKTGYTYGASQSSFGVVIARLGDACAADFNHDTVADFFDYLDFVDAFAAGESVADVNADGIVDFFDYLDFVASFAAGC